MTTGEKIRYYRNLRGISQEMLGELSGIHYATIKKYELGIRNPKPEQLLKLANALGISINVFLDLDISTVSDVLSLLFKMDEEIDMKITADKNANGTHIPSTLKISFENMELNKRLCKYLDAKDLQCSAMERFKDSPMNSEEKIEINNLENTLDEIKQSLVDSNLVIRKGVSGITVRVPQFDFSPQELVDLQPKK